MNNEIVMINVANINPHPDNPRKGLGDLTELADSIKENGILQNLTVVPWFSEITKAPADNGEMDGCYRAVIGHRRLAAAKLAGIDEVPCVISDMDYKTQVSTMLLENMQRSDLTVYEQAQGFQMMLDLGETISGIVEKTGFSESTVRHRIKLTELDQELLAEKAVENISITDLIKLEEIKDTKEKNELLKFIGTDEFNWKYTRAKDRQRKDKRKAIILEGLKEFAKPPEEATYKLTYKTYINYMFDEKEIEAKLEEIRSGDEELYYKADNYGVSIYIESDESPEENNAVPTPESNNEREENHKKLDEIWQQMMNACDDYIKGYSESKIKNSNAILIEYAASAYLENKYSDCEDIVALIGIDDEAEKYLNKDGDTDPALVTADLLQTSVRKIFLYGIYISYKPSTWEKPYRYNNQFTGSKYISRFYNLMKDLGYKLSEEEQQMLDGTHELYKKEELERGDGNDET